MSDVEQHWLVTTVSPVELSSDEIGYALADHLDPEDNDEPVSVDVEVA